MEKLVKLSTDKRNIKQLVKAYLKNANKYSFIKEHQTLFTNALLTSNITNNYGYSFQFNPTNVIRVATNSASGFLIASNNPLISPYTITLRCLSVNTNNSDMYVMTGLHAGNLGELTMLNNAIQPVTTQAKGFMVKGDKSKIYLASANWLGFSYIQDSDIGPLESYRIVYQNNGSSSRYMQYTMDSNTFSIINVNGARVWSIANSIPTIEYLFILIKPFSNNADNVNQECVFELTVNSIT